MTESEMDEQLDIIEDFWEEQDRAEDEYDARQAEIEEAYQQGAREFAEWCLQNNIDFSHCESDCDNCTRIICRNAQTYTDVVLAEWKKGAE